ncbi:MAG: hypothetical protein ABIX46_00705 [Burkholderiaceae bacterium]
MLRSAKTVHCSTSGGGTICTVLRAGALIGFAGIRNTVMSLMRLEHLCDKGRADPLKEEFMRALMAGSFTCALNPLARDGEGALINAMFQNLGRLLAELYLPDEARQIRERRWWPRTAGASAIPPPRADSGLAPSQPATSTGAVKACTLA